MNSKKIVLGTNSQFGPSTKEQIELFHKVGFDGFFTMFEGEEKIREYRKLADELGMIYQSVHSDFVEVDKMWQPYEQAEGTVKGYLQCVGACAENGIPVMVMHTFIGFDKHEPNQYGIDNFEIVVQEAERLGVKIAFENTEGEEYLACLMDHFKGRSSVGFCWDTGHEMCYNHSKDMTALYGDRLIATHLNDNLGISDADGKITWLDDLHLLPFDGIGDFEGIASRLKKHNFNGPMTFELNTLSKPGRHENDVYSSMPIEDYLRSAYSRARRFVEFLDE